MPKPITDEIRSKIIAAQAALDALRDENKISKPGEIVFRDEDYGSKSALIVVADGLGGATLQEVEGNYPVDYLNNDSREWESEADAVLIATMLTESQISHHEAFQTVLANAPLGALDGGGNLVVVKNRDAGAVLKYITDEDEANQVREFATTADALAIADQLFKGEIDKDEAFGGEATRI